jgi:hypothetical protein
MRIEEIFGWLKTVALLWQTRHRGTARVEWMFVFALAVYNLVRIRDIAGQPGEHEATAREPGTRPAEGGESLGASSPLLILKSKMAVSRGFSAPG